MTTLTMHKITTPKEPLMHNVKTNKELIYLVENREIEYY